MSDRAHVTSTDALEAFRANIIHYLSRAKPVLEDAIDEVQRTRQWVQHDRRLYWENQLKRRRRALEEAEQAVFSARIATLREVTTAENAAVLRARRALAEAEDKLRLIKRWSMDFDNRVQPLVKQLEQLRTMLSNNMPKGAAHLAQLTRTLDAYANIKTQSAAAPAELATDATTPPDAEPGSAGILPAETLPAPNAIPSAAATASPLTPHPSLPGAPAQSAPSAPSADEPFQP